MPEKRIKKDFGEVECQYRYCKKKFKKSKPDHEFCCPKHRLAEWNLLNPRIKKNSNNQLPKGTVHHGLPIVPNKEIYEKSKITKRTFHYTMIGRDNKRGKILRSTLHLMMQCNPSTREINEYTGSTRGSSDVSELRAQGFDSVCIKCGDINLFKLTDIGREKAVKFFQEI